MATAAIPFLETQQSRRRLSFERSARELIELADQPQVEDVVINPDGSLWVNRTGEGFQFVRPVSEEWVQSILLQIAFEQGFPFSTTHPILETDIPESGARLTGLCRPIVRGVALTIRPHPKVRRTLSDYRHAGIVSRKQDALNVKSQRAQFLDLARNKDHGEILSLAIEYDQNILVGGSTGAGKALPVEAKVLTPFGYQEIGTLKPGDTVFGNSGEPIRVTGVFPQGVKPASKITFSDDVSVRCCNDHLWSVTDKYSRKSPKVLSTSEIQSRICKTQHAHFKLAIPVCRPVQFPYRDLPVDPYLLGTLIGNGSCHGTTIKITLPDADIVQRISRLATDINCILRPVHQGTANIDYRFRRTDFSPYHNRRVYLQQANRLTNAITILNLRVRSYEKFIPDEYKLAHAEARLALFQGLMDTDGSVSGSGLVEYGTSSQQLATDVVCLAQSLGCIVRLSERQPVYTYRGERKVGRTAYRLSIKIPQGMIPFQSTRKLGSFKPRSKYPVLRQIERIEPDGEAEMVCISVDAPDGLFLIEHCVVTHNTTFLKMLLSEIGRLRRTDRIVGIEDTLELQWNDIPNHVALLSSHGVSAARCLETALRLKPDRIVVGEIRKTKAARALLDAWNTGHRGGLATVHADDARSTLQRFEEILREEVRPAIARAVNVVAFIDECDQISAGRKLKEIVIVHGYDKEKEDYELEWV